jgi:uncharacterized protein YggT (Ycf19 family)
MQPMNPRTFAWFARALAYLVYAFVVVALVILTFGFFLQLFGANPDAPFAEWVYRSLKRVMSPFRGLFEPVSLRGDSVLDVSILFAMIVYGLVALLLRSLIDWLTVRAQERAPTAGDVTSQRRRRDGAVESRTRTDDMPSGRR